ncbi:histone H1 [Mucilaginibacter sp. AW1-7]|uniref:histone H1 n=1 Tax=Mucilaginibacter sp. AW1-7 TaxID=3349874 RepID=UPI003F73BF35
MNAFEKLKALVEGTEKDAGSFYLKGNKAAGVRLRKALQDIKAIAQEGRNEVSELKRRA